MHAYIDEQKRICVVMERKEAVNIHDLLHQFYNSDGETFEGTCMKILKDGDYPDALPGFEEEYDKTTDDLYDLLDETIEKLD
jgi:hypothetical protein